VPVLTSVLQQDVTVPTQTPSQFWFAVVVLVIGGALSLYLWYRTDFSGLPDAQQERKASLRRQAAAASPSTVTIPSTADASEYWDALSETIDAVTSGDPDRTAETGVSLPRALNEARSELSRAWQPVLEKLPRRAKWALGFGFAIAVMGAIAVSTSAVVAWLEGGDGMPPLVELAGDAVALTMDVLAAGVDLLLAFPFASTLWALAFTYGVLAVRWLYEHWYVTAPVVILAGLALAVFDHRADRPDTWTLYERRSAALSVLGSAVVVWVAGTVPAALGLLAGVPTVGAAVGFLLAFGIVVVLGVGAVAGLTQDVLLAAGAGVRFRRVARYRPSRVLRRGVQVVAGLPVGGAQLPDRTEGRDPDWALVGSIVVRRALGVASGVLLVILAAYVVVALVEGRLTRVLVAFVNSPADTKLLVGVLVAIPLGVLAVQIRAAWPDLRAALGEAMARQGVRMAILGRGLPYGTVVFAYIVAHRLFQSIPVAVALAVASGVVLRGLYALLLKSQHRVSMLSSEDPHPSSTVVRVYPQLDAGGEGRYYAVVNGETRVLWPDRDEFEAQLRETVRDVRDRDAEPNAMATWHARDAFEYGIVDVDETRQKITEKIRKHTITPLRKNNRAEERETLLDGLQKFPEDLREQRWADWYEKGILRRVDDLLVLERDPWKET